MTNDFRPKIAIIGCGTYGAYLLKGLLDTVGNGAELTVVEVGNERTKSESEMGYLTESNHSHAAEQGRYFGLGGTSARWGGQVLFFDKYDNPKNDSDWQHIIAVNHQFKGIVLKKLLNGSFSMDESTDGKIPTKTGIWLKYSKRNLFKSLKTNDLSKVKWLKNTRVVDIELENSTIKALICQNTEGGQMRVEADIFYLTAGAIESCRLLLSINEKHNCISSTDLGKHFGDHISAELFKIKNHKPTLWGADILPRLTQGSLITKRFVVANEVGRVGFAHPVFNKEVQVFTTIKRFLFGRQQLNLRLKDIFIGFEFLIRFAFSVFVLKKMYAHRNTWSLQLDIEQAFPNNNFISLSSKTDSFGQKAAQLNWQVSADDQAAILTIQADLAKKLHAENIDFESVYDPKISGSKIEDVYHPVGFMRLGQDKNSVLDTDCRVRGLDNLFHFSTALFPSAKSINPTAAAFCFIEQHLTEKLFLKIRKN